MTDCTEPSTPSTSSTLYIHSRREPFEHGLIPIPKLIFTDGVQTLGPLKDKLIQRSTQSPNRRVDLLAVSEILQISPDHARLVIDTLSTVLDTNSDPLVAGELSEVDSVDVDVCDLVLFLYIQSYKRLLPRTHKDSASVADVWPSTSAFDGYLSALSPLQFVRSNSRRFMPSQADEEAHQLSYLQKHLANILSLLADSVEGEGEESLGPERIPLSLATPFFANTDPDMPAAPVPATQVLDWLLQNITSTLENISERVSAKENGLPSASDQDVPMGDSCGSFMKASATARGPCFIEGISKSSYLKQASDLHESSVKVVNCHDSVIYILAPLRYATIYGCSDATIVLGAVGKAVRVEHCERVHVITAAKRICIANCRECAFFLGVAPYNTFYSHLEEHMNQVGIQATINRWDDPVPLGVVDPHDSLSHPAGVSDVKAESATCLDPDQFTNFLIPNWFEGESSGSTKDNPFPLPDAYMSSQRRNNHNLGAIKQNLRETQLEDSRKHELASALHVYFKDWLYGFRNLSILLFTRKTQEAIGIL
ncbi:C-CAP/cofactor C-like domain-containing protein [Actinidia rufa]|uniref:TBCC domain-containing protein 1 n=1 Tax=Actinidia rufa TaxID=165716 RepID=A0A7J0E3A7_9ERIC|nr:C-CAP/cofactor C-like domain-containing protein [Actinidia rufa]